MVASLTSLNYSADALVVGAGPAGIAAAETLSEAGVKTVLIDRHFKPGAKACAGTLTQEAWRPAGIDPSTPDADVQVFDSIAVRAPLGAVPLRPGGPLLATIDRLRWTEKKLSRLRSSGVDVRLGERLLRLEKSSASTSFGNCRFEYLVAADGAISGIRKQLGLDPSPSMRAWQIRLNAPRARIKGLDPDKPAIWFDPFRARSGYCWSFPYFDELRVGMGASLRALDARSLKRAFFSWLAELGFNRTHGVIQTGAIGCDYAGHRFGRIFLAGDAAGLASPLTGEGISQALISGREVAREIIDPGYRSRAIAELAARHRRTHDVLSNSYLCGPLYLLSPGLLRVPYVRKVALSRYIK